LVDEGRSGNYGHGGVVGVPPEKGPCTSFEPGGRPGATAGILLILGIVTSLASTAVLGDVLSGAHFLDTLSDHGGSLRVAAALQLLTAVGAPAIALAMYPYLRPHSPTLAIAAVVFRAVEGAMYAVSALSLLSLGALSEHDPTNGSGAAAALVVLRDSTNFVAGVFFFGLGGLAYYLVLQRDRLVPRVLGWWGIVGVGLVAAGAVATLADGSPYTIGGAGAALAVPIAVQEVAMGLWLIFRGFSRE
jgi:hypothetical protein